MDFIKATTELVERGRAGDRPMGFLMSMYAPEVVEVAASFGFDWLLIDQEHTSISTTPQVLELVRIAELHNMPAIVKLPAWDPIKARDAFDVAAVGIQVPFVDDVKMLREVISACRFRPIGTRGFCRVARTAGFSATPTDFDKYLLFQNNHTLIIPNIETAEAVENLDEILANSPECPVFSVGPDDLRMSLDMPYNDPEADLEFRKIVTAVCKKIHAAGKLNMMPIWGPHEANPPEALAENMSYVHNDFPYTSDGVCLAYAFKESMRIREAGAAHAKKQR